MREERLYRIEFPDGHVFARCGDDEHFTSVDPTSVDLSQPWKFNFTEKEIKLAGEKYWMFAKEVTE